MAKETIDFHYIKSNNFNVYHIDGGYGGITPKGYLGINLFSERFPIPKKETYELKMNKELGVEELGKRIDKETETKKGIIRHVECEVIMNIETAISIKNWLDRQINKFHDQVRAKKDGGKENESK